MKDDNTYSHHNSNNTRLNDYLQNNMSDQQRHDFEMEFQDDPFFLDALEGLTDLNNPQHVKEIHEHLNRFVKIKTTQKKEKKYKPIQFPTWLILLAAMVFLMAIAGIVLVKWLQN